MNNKQNFMQTVWGTALLLMGIAVFFRIPSLLRQISAIEQYVSVGIFIRFSLYLMAVLLVGGGIKKLYTVFKTKKNDQ